MLVFEFLDHAADSGRRDVQLLRRNGQGTRVNNGKEIFQGDVEHGRILLERGANVIGYYQMLAFYCFPGVNIMKLWIAGVAISAASSFAHAADKAITVYQDPDCGCCSGWVQHMRDSGFDVKAIKTADMASVKNKLGVPSKLSSCHTAVVAGTGQIIEGHVPAAAVNKLLANPNVTGVSAPGMPLNAPGMGELDGNLITVDFNGTPFSRD
jgi:hypothetical protein